MSTEVVAWGAVVVDHNDGMGARSIASRWVMWGAAFCRQVRRVRVYVMVEEYFVGSVSKNFGKLWALFHRTRLVLCEWLEFGHGKAEVVLRESIG